MASISTDAKGNRRIKFYDSEGKQRGIRIGRVDKKTAERLCRDVEELLAARRMGQPVHPQTADNVSRLNGAIRRRFERVGLLEPVAGELPAMALGAFITAYIEGRTDVKASTKDNNYRHAHVVLIEYFGADRRLSTITPGDAEEFRIWLQTQRPAKHKKVLAINTVRTLCRVAKQMFAHAEKKRLIAESPFAGIKGLQVRGTVERQLTVPLEWIDRVLEACPNEDWRLLVVLCRYGGLRPAEACNLRWEHIDWQSRKIRVLCQKTARHEGRAWRVVPIFPEIAPHLEASRGLAEDGAEMVIARYRSNRNLRKPFQDIVKRAGLAVWPKPFQNLRSTRENELMRRHAEHVVCGWIGNTQRVAREHYLTATDEDFHLAIDCPTAAVRDSEAAGQPTARTTQRSGPKSGPAGSASGGRQRHGAKPPQTADDEIAVLDAWCRSVQSRTTSPDESQNSPSRIRTYNLAVNSRSLYR